MILPPEWTSMSGASRAGWMSIRLSYPIQHKDHDRIAMSNVEGSLAATKSSSATWWISTRPIDASGRLALARLIASAKESMAVTWA